jgi:hypothetical protein
MRLGSGFAGRFDLRLTWRPSGRPCSWGLGEYPFLRALSLAVSLLQRVPLANAPKEPKVCALTFGPLAGARGSFAPGSIRGHRFRFASLHLLSMCSTSSNGAARLPPDQSLHSACRRAFRSKAVLELTLIVLSGEEQKRFALALLWERACSRRRPDSRPVFCRCTQFNCGSEPAREGGLIADLFSTGVLNPTVGASLLAKAA